MNTTTISFIRRAILVGICAAIAACADGGGDDSTPTDGNGSGATPTPPVVSHLADVCPQIVDLVSGMNIKYKSQNVHGGRGPSWIMGCGVQHLWPVSTYLATFPVYSVLGNEIGKFVVYDPGQKPYGNRSYTGLPGGYPADSSTLANSALADGSAEFYVNVKGGTCYKVTNPLVDEGSINAIYGTGPC